MNSGDTAWVLISAGLVLFMTPGLALFYGGMVRAKNLLAMLMQNFFSMGLVSVLWATVGFSLAFGPDTGLGIIGGLHPQPHHPAVLDLLRPGPDRRLDDDRVHHRRDPDRQEPGHRAWHHSPLPERGRHAGRIFIGLPAAA